MLSSKEKQGEVREPSSVINEKRDENNRMEKTRDLFKKIRDTKGAFHAKMVTIKDRNGMDQTKAKDIKTIPRKRNEKRQNGCLRRP